MSSVGELEAIEVTTPRLEPGCEYSSIIAQPHPRTILLSHFEVKELSPPCSSAEVSDLRLDRVSYLITPVPLLLLEREQRIRWERAEQQARQHMPLLGLLDPQRLRKMIKSDRRNTRVIALDICWKPQQPLIMSFKNSGASVIDKISIELVLYSLDNPLPFVH